MEPEKLIIGIVIFGLMITSGVLFLSDLSSDYISVSKEHLSELNKIDDLTSTIINPMANQTMSAGAPEEGVLSTGVRLSSGVYSALRYIFGLPALLVGMLGLIAGHLGIPNYIVGGFTAIIFIIVTFVIIKFIFGRK